MKNLFSRKFLCLVSALTLIGLMVPCTASAEDKEEDIHAVILLTSDLHANTWGYSYEDNTETTNNGMPRVYTYIQEVRKENPIVFLVDAGDAIQGTIMTDDIANKKPDQEHPVMAAMNKMGYDSMTLGNHEFNWGIDSMLKILGQAEFPVLGENVLDEEGNVKLDAQGQEIWLVKPTIEKIKFVVADNDTLIKQLADGELHLVNKVTYGPTIEEGRQGEDAIAAGIRAQAYPRIGMSFLTFTYEWPTVHDKEVRQAIAWCMDRQMMADEYCGRGNGVVMNGYFGMETWEYLLVTGQMSYPVNFVNQVIPPVSETATEEEKEAYEEKVKELLGKGKNLYVTTEDEYDVAVAAWQALTNEWKGTLTEYTVALDKANALLDDAGWTFNREGGAYQPGVDDVRCKKQADGSFLPLDLKMLYPEGNHMAEIMADAGKDKNPVEDKDWTSNFVDNLARVGIKLEMVPAPMTELLQAYYRQTERTTDMIYLATNFHVIVDPSITYSTDKTKNHQIWNNTYSDDEDLWYRAKNMRETEPGDVFEYVSKWVSFQDRYNEILPTIPIYSNIYYDFYNQYLQNYYITGQVTWSQAILPAYFALEDYNKVILEEEETEEEGMESFDE